MSMSRVGPKVVPHFIKEFLIRLIIIHGSNYALTRLPNLAS